MKRIRFFSFAFAFAAALSTIGVNSASAAGGSFFDLTVTAVNPSTVGILVKTSKGVVTISGSCSNEYFAIRQDYANWSQMYQMAMAALLSGKKTYVYINKTTCATINGVNYPVIMDMSLYN